MDARRRRDYTIDSIFVACRPIGLRLVWCCERTFTSCGLNHTEFFAVSKRDFSQLQSQNERLGKTLASMGEKIFHFCHSWRRSEIGQRQSWNFFAKPKFVCEERCLAGKEFDRAVTIPFHCRSARENFSGSSGIQREFRARKRHELVSEQYSSTYLGRKAPHVASLAGDLSQLFQTLTIPTGDDRPVNDGTTAAEHKGIF